MSGQLRTLHDRRILSGVVITAGDLFDLAAMPSEGPEDIVLIGSVAGGSILKRFGAGDAYDPLPVIEHDEKDTAKAIVTNVLGRAWVQWHLKSPACKFSPIW